ncbi:DUF7523 family protein [Halobellus inordinatus]|uniref:DUF7523 family protein n=1 Tax=Halobellus inordinatus TaxID=1126236 RepID=UPI002114B3CD|nr:hypothetical protein [Halobellus ramosii]
MSLAAETRAAVRARPWLLQALRAGVVNYAAAAESLDVDGDTDSIATALRRFADDLEPAETAERDVVVRMRSGVGLAGVDVAADDSESLDLDAGAEALLSVGEEAVVTADGSLTAIVVDGEVDASALTAVMGRLRAENVLVDAAGVAGDELVVVVPRSDGASALRTVEDALASVSEL